MKVLHLYKDYPPVLGGIEGHVRQLAEGQAARGHEVTVLVTSLDRSTTETIEGGVRVVRAARLAHAASTPLSLRFIREYRRRQDEVHVVHLHFPYPPADATWLLDRRPPPTVLTYHSDIVRQRVLRVAYAPLLRRVLEKVDRVLATSPQYVERSAALRRVDDDRLRVVPLAVDASRFTAAERSPTNDSGRLRLLFVGRLRYYKGLQFLLDAMARLDGRVTLEIVGTGPQERELREQSDRLGLTDVVTFAGDVDDAELPRRYALADAFVLPACEPSEAFGIVQLEAMAAELPVVATRLGTGVEHVNLDGETGLLVPPGDAAALVTAVERLRADAALRRRLGVAGRQRVLTEFTVERMLDRVDAVYEEIVGEST